MNARNGIEAPVPAQSNHDGDVCHTREAEEASVAFHFFRGAESLLEVIGQLHGWPPFDVIQLADQAQRMERVIALRISVAEIIGQQRAPAGAEADASFAHPFLLIEEIPRIAEIRRLSAIE